MWACPLPVMLLRRTPYYKLQGPGYPLQVLTTLRCVAGFTLLSLTQGKALKLMIILRA